MPELGDKLAIESNLVNKLDKQSTGKLATEGVTSHGVGNVSNGSSPTVIVNNLLASWSHVS